MFRSFKYFIYFLILASLFVFYFLFTPLGNSSLYHILSQELSKKIDLDIEIKSIDIWSYPQVKLIINVHQKAKLTLNGYLDDTRMDMHYTLSSECIATEECKIDDTIAIHGQIKGYFSKLILSGEGVALDGHVNYKAIKNTDKVEEVHLKMEDINSSKLLRLLGQTAIIKGKANATVYFSSMSKKHKQGYITYDVKDNNFKGIPLSLHTKVNINNNIHTFVMDITSDYLTLNLSKGIYKQEQKTAHAHYVLDIKELSKLEQLLGYKYNGAFYAIGEMSYAKYFKVTGLSKSYGGMTDFIFENDGLKVRLDDVLLHEILALFPFPSMLVAKATGHIYYNFIQDTLVVNTRLSNAKFLHCKLANIIRKKSGVNMLDETFDNSTLDITYHNNIIVSELKLANDHSHIHLSNAKIDTKKETINAYFDFKMQKQEFSGKVYGALDKPKVNLNMQKLIRYQMDKQVDKMIGKNNRKIMENMPMGNVAKDLATDMGASFMKVFF
jgi:hypothetical protein